MDTFYKGFYIEEIRKQGDEAMFSRVVGYQANHPRGYCVKGISLRDTKQAVREFLIAKKAGRAS